MVQPEREHTHDGVTDTALAPVVCTQGNHGSPCTAQWFAMHCSDVYDMYTRATMSNVDFMATIVHLIDNRDAHHLPASTTNNYDNGPDADDVD